MVTSDSRILSNGFHPDAGTKTIGKKPEYLVHTELETATGLIGTSISMVAVQQQIMELSRTNLDALLKGEPGTGKELAAKAIYHLSRKSDETNGKKFVIVNCPAIPKELVESELFGYRGRSFTGSAPVDREGKIMQANGGVLFFDEIGELEFGIQSKILRLLGEREISMIGSAESQKVNVRIIAATNKNLEKAIQDHQFREDLFDRLNAEVVEMPPLRERKDDIDRLTWYFADRHKPLNTELVGIKEEVFELLHMQPFAGNVRELEHCVHNAVQKQYAADQDNKMVLDPFYIARFKFREGKLSTELKFDLDAKSHPLTIGSDDGLTPTEIVKKRMLLQALSRVKWNRSAAAALAGIGRQTAYNWMKKFGILKPPSKYDRSSTTQTPVSNNGNGHLAEPVEVQPARNGEAEKQRILEQMKKSGGIVPDAATVLGVKSGTLYGLIRRHDLWEAVDKIRNESHPISPS